MPWVKMRPDRVVANDPAASPARQSGTGFMSVVGSRVELRTHFTPEPYHLSLIPGIAFYDWDNQWCAEV